MFNPALKKFSGATAFAAVSLLWATTAHAVPTFDTSVSASVRLAPGQVIPSGLEIFADIDFFLDPKFPPVNATQNSSISLISGGTTTTATSNGISVTPAGSTPLEGFLTQAGDGVSGSSTISRIGTNVLADVGAFIDFFIDIDNSGEEVILTFEVTRSLSASVADEGDDVFSDAAVIIDKVPQDILAFETVLDEIVEADGLLGPLNASISETTTTFDVTVAAESFTSVEGTIAAFGQAFSENESEFAVQLTTGSPVTISQTISRSDVPDDEFVLTFDREFLTSTGELEVTLDGSPLGTFTGPDAGFVTESILVDLVDLGLDGNIEFDLAFTLDGPAGSSVLLDNINFPGLVNGDFENGDLSAFDVTASANASAGVAQLTVVPEPGTLAVFGFGLLGLGMVRRRKAV